MYYRPPLQVAARCGRPIVVTAVAARDKAKDRGVDLKGITWFDDPAVMAAKVRTTWSWPVDLLVR